MQPVLDVSVSHACAVDRNSRVTRTRASFDGDMTYYTMCWKTRYWPADYVPSFIVLICAD